MSRGTAVARIRRFAVMTMLAGLMAAAQPAAHEIPMDVAVQLFLKPDGQELQLLARLPLRAMRDIDFPQRSSGSLDLARADAALRTAAVQWIANGITLYENDAPIPAGDLRAVRVSLPSDRSFGSYSEAHAHLTGPPLSVDTNLPWDQGLLDVWLTYRIRSERSEFAIRPGAERLGLRVVTALRFLPPGGIVRAFELTGDPGIVRLDPRWHQAALRFVELGFFHILDGMDHLLFLICMVIPLRRLRPLVLVVTCFTLAHSITLVASTFGFVPGALWFPPLVETLIAASIVYMALENIVAPARAEGRWIIAFAFGLVHGFGFSFALRETLQFAGSHLLTSLLSFNLGVEIGQVVVLLLIVPGLQALFRFGMPERVGVILLSALVAHTGWHWMMERLDVLRQYRWPGLDLVLLASIGRSLIVTVLAIAIGWLASVLWRRARIDAPSPKPPPL